MKCSHCLPAETETEQLIYFKASKTPQQRSLLGNNLGEHQNGRSTTLSLSHLTPCLPPWPGPSQGTPAIPIPLGTAWLAAPSWEGAPPALAAKLSRHQDTVQVPQASWSNKPRKGWGMEQTVAMEQPLPQHCHCLESQLCWLSWVNGSQPQSPSPEQ